jgi:hypothetical protein
MLLITYMDESTIDRVEEKRLILEAIVVDRFALRDHAIRRGDERELSRLNVLKVAETLIEWKYQEDKYTHWFIGFLAKGQPGGFTAILDDEVRVVTVFKRRLSRREKTALSPALLAYLEAGEGEDG